MRFHTVVLALGVLSSCALAQMPRQAVVPVNEKAACYCDAWLLPQSSSTATLAICTRSAPALYCFHAAKQNESGAAYEAVYSTSISISDTTGVIKHSIFYQDTLRVNDMESTRQRAASILRSFSVSLPMNVYSVKIDIEQLEGALQRTRLNPLDLSLCSSRSVCPYPVMATNTGEEVLQPLCRQQSVDFGTNAVRFVWTVANRFSNDGFEWKCTKKNASDDWFPTTYVEQHGSCSLSNHSVLQSKSTALNLSDSVLVTVHNDSIPYDLLQCTLNTELMTPGQYVLLLYKPRSKDSIRISFDCRWPNMPNALRSLSLNAMVMRFLLSDKEYDAIFDGSETDTRRHLLNWWKAKDPTPATAYNEAMMAFYRRCDEARTLYITPAENDGLKTERGKVYVLYGKPTSIQRLSPKGSAAKEIWTYDNKVKKRISFERDQRDVYRIMSVENLTR